MEENTTSLAPEEFAPETVYLNTASLGLPAARTVKALRDATDVWAAGRTDVVGYDVDVRLARERFARLVGTTPDRVAIGSQVSGLTGIVANSLPEGASVLVAEGDFTSLTQPFVSRADLRLTFVPLDRIIDSVEPGIDLVAVSAVQSADGRVTDIAALSEQVRARGARLLVDATQAAGWLPLNAADADYLVCGTYKWLTSPRGVAFLVLHPDADKTLRQLTPGWYAGDDPWAECYTSVRFAESARRFDLAPVWLSFVGTATALGLIEEIGVDAIHGHDTALAQRLRTGLAEFGYEATPGASAIVSVPGLGWAHERLIEAGVVVSNRAGNLRAAFHFYNSAADVDRVLEAVSTLK